MVGSLAKCVWVLSRALIDTSFEITVPIASAKLVRGFEISLGSPKADQGQETFRLINLNIARGDQSTSSELFMVLARGVYRRPCFHIPVVALYIAAFCILSSCALREQ